MRAETAFARLLPVLLPADCVPLSGSINDALRTPGWAKQACERDLGPTFKVFLGTRNLDRSLPPEARERLESAYMENLARSVVREEVLRNIVTVFGEFGACPILLKGLAFAYQLYPDPAARRVGDIDVLVEYELRQEAEQALARAGFQRVSEQPQVPKGHRDFFRAVGKLAGIRSTSHAPVQQAEAEDCYVAEAGGTKILVEVHYHMINLRAGGGKENVFRSRAEAMPSTTEAEVAGCKVRVLTPEAAFLHALRHLALHHRFIGLRWHHDLALMLWKWDSHLDPLAIRQECKRLGSEKILDVEIALIRELFGSEGIPPQNEKSWSASALPWEYPLYRHIARGGKRTPFREAVRTLLAPSLKEQLETLT